MFGADFQHSLTVIIKIKLIVIVQITGLLLAEYATPIVGFIGVTGSATYIWLKVYNEFKQNNKKK